MKKMVLFIAVLIIVVSCKNENVKEKKNAIKPTEHNGYYVKGTINLPDNSIILLQEQLINKKYKTIKTTTVKNNSFNFSDKIVDEHLYYIGFKSNNSKTPFIANNFETFIVFDLDNKSNTKIEGSKIQQDFSSYEKGLSESKNKFAYSLKYIKNNASSNMAAIVLKTMLGKTKWRIEQNKKAYNYLNSSVKNSSIGKYINSFITKNEVLVATTESVAEVSLDPEITNETPVAVVVKKVKKVTTPYRKKAPNFFAESIKGNDVSLNSVLKNNKVVLIDFWASWCAPCRAESPQIKRLYRKYHSKGFDVIGVSEDKYSDMNKWKNAISVDGLPWHQVIDDNKRIAHMFGVKSIPHTVLLDKNGGIILNKKTTYTIERKLKEIFGY